ncbi:MAG: ribose-phosphate pyrophosphokinase [Sphingomicrobium sp.]
MADDGAGRGAADGEGAGRLADPAEVRAILIASARAGEPITYGDILGLLGHRFSRPKMRALCKVLSTIDDEAEELGEPELAVLVVRQSDGLPGQGWWIGGAPKHCYTGGWEGAPAARLIRKIQAQAFDFWSSHKGRVQRDGALRSQ